MLIGNVGLIPNPKLTTIRIKLTTIRINPIHGRMRSKKTGPLKSCCNLTD